MEDKRKRKEKRRKEKEAKGKKDKMQSKNFCLSTENPADALKFDISRDEELK